MSHNHTPHFAPEDYARLRSGGSLKDGWSYVMPQDEVVNLNAEVTVAFVDEELDPHVAEQAQALKALYLSSKSEPIQFPMNAASLESLVDSTAINNSGTSNGGLVVEADESERDDEMRSSRSSQRKANANIKHFIVKQGMQVVGVATYHEDDGKLYDVAVRPSAGKEASYLLFDAVRKHVTQKLKRSGSLVVLPRSAESRLLFEQYGFTEVTERNDM
jgi:hypothetical protein